MTRVRTPAPQMQSCYVHILTHVAESQHAMIAVSVIQREEEWRTAPYVAAVISDVLSESFQATAWSSANTLHEGADSHILIAAMWLLYTRNLNTVADPGIVIELVNVIDQLARHLAGALATYATAFAVDAVLVRG